MKQPRVTDEILEIDPIDHDLLEILQEDCRLSLARIGERVGLSAPSVLERIKKLEAARVVCGYEAILDGRRLGLEVTAFVGIFISHPNHIQAFLDRVDAFPAVQEAHQVTGSYTVLLKVKAATTLSLGELIGRINRIEGVTRSETTVVLSTHTERVRMEVPRGLSGRRRRARRSDPGLRGDVEQ